MKRIFLLAFVFVIQTRPVIAQVPYYIFDQDSLKGFDEEAARASAISEHFLGAEFKVRMFRLKREFINNKYGLKNNASYNTGYSVGAARPTFSQGCVNEDFEASSPGMVTNTAQVLGWTITGGYNGFVGAGSPATLQAAFPGGLSSANSCNLLGCCPLPPVAEVIDCSAPGGYIDNVIGSQYPIYSVFGTGTVSGAAASNTQITQGMFGTKVLRLNDYNTGDYSIGKLTKTIYVSSSNALFQFAFISVFVPGHGCCDAGGMGIKIYNHGTSSSGTPTLSCPFFSLSALSSACTSTVPMQYYVVGGWTPHNFNNFNNIYHPWMLYSMDLSIYIGKYITLETVVSDCNAGGHFGCVYLDAKCGPVTFKINNLDVNEADSVTTLVSCLPTATVAAPSGLFSYQWTGPGGFTSNSSVINPTVSGIYTLSTICSTAKLINIVFSSASGTITSSHNALCNGSSAILTSLDMANCVWDTGDNTPSIQVSPTVTTTYSVSGVNGYGCPVSAMITQNVEDCTGLISLNVQDKVVSIYPNPNHGEFVLNLGLKADKASLQVKNTLGQLVHAQSIRNGKNIIKTKEMPAGVYYYTVLDGERTLSKGKFRIE